MEQSRRDISQSRASSDARTPRTGDVVKVTRIDRLPRSTFDLFGIVERIVERIAPAPVLQKSTRLCEKSD
jgi:hypothetical protein